MIENILLSEEYDRFWTKIKNNENFALIRSEDGEHSIVCREPFVAQADDGWRSTGEKSQLGTDIDATYDV